MQKYEKEELKGEVGTTHNVIAAKENLLKYIVLRTNLATLVNLF